MVDITTLGIADLGVDFLTLALILLLMGLLIALPD